jgi:alcohol dehydrogenase (NADP+)
MIMNNTKAYAAQSPTDRLGPFSLQRREPGANDVKIEILYCGVCHSDIHQVRDEWGGSIFPMVPGHEIVGKVTEVGDQVAGFKVGDLAGIGCFVDSCRTCPNCQAGLEQYCLNGMSATYNSYEQDKKTPTYGGYSTQIVVNQDYVLKVSPNLPLEAVAPLLCAGITTYSPLRHWQIGKGHKIGILGLGGLGHMAVKFGAAFGAEVTMLSTSPSKEADAKRLGAHHFVLTSKQGELDKLAYHFDFIIDTVSAPHDYGAYLKTIKTSGTLICVGVPPEPLKIPGFDLIGQRRSVGASMIGGIAETQEMLDYCAEHNIVSDVEVIQIQDINEAYDRMMKNDVKYRFVIDSASLRK